MPPERYQQFHFLILHSVGFVVVGLLVLFASLLFSPKEAELLSGAKEVVLEAHASEREYRPITLNGQLLATEAEYDIEKVVVAQNLRNITNGTKTVNELNALFADWQKIVDFEQCHIVSTSLRLPDDMERIIQLSSDAVASGTCRN